MNQIQKCPFCRKDALFCGEICPNCGHASKWEEREEPNLCLDSNGRVPVYTETLEQQLSPTQKRGRMLFCVVYGMLIFPLVAWNTINLFLSFSMNNLEQLSVFPPLLYLSLALFLTRFAWLGRQWARISTAAFTLFAGIILTVSLLIPFWGSSSISSLAGTVYGAVAFISAIILFSSKDIADFMNLQARQKNKL